MTIRNKMKKIWHTFLRAYAAGMMIAVGAAVYTKCSNNIVGAVLFSIGLITILVAKFNLYTGKVGYILEDMDILKQIPIILLGNIAGAFCASLWCDKQQAIQIIETKLSLDPMTIVYNAMLCGILIYFAVYLYKQMNSAPILAVILVITTFIVSGAEHSIADICYAAASGIFSWKLIGYLCLIILGNAVGSILSNSFVRIAEWDGSDK